MPTIIRGTKGIDTLYGTSADERLVGGAGQDWIEGYGGHDDIYGGTGNDVIFLWGGTGRALGGKGDDYVEGTHGTFTLAGGVGDDTIYGTGRLFGDERPGLPQRTIGDDLLITDLNPAFGETHSTHTGGRGNDEFNVQAFLDGLSSSVTVTDFTPGQDALAVSLSYTDGHSPKLDSATIWSALDSNGNGRLGDDVPWTDNATVTVGQDGLTIRLHEDTVTIAGVDTITASDWAF